MPNKGSNKHNDDNDVYLKTAKPWKVWSSEVNYKYFLHCYLRPCKR